MEIPGTHQRAGQLDDIAEALPARASNLTRLFLKRSRLNLSRTEVGVLRACAEAPQRVGDLAAAEGVTQPAISLLVNRLAERGWLERGPDPDDRRAVRVSVTESGREVFDQLRAEYRAFFHEEMTMLDDAEVATLADAVDILDKLVDRLSAAD